MTAIWIWGAVSLLAGLAALGTGATAVAVMFAIGAYHHQLTQRQRKLGKLGAIAGLAASPAMALLAIAAAYVALRQYLGG